MSSLLEMLILFLFGGIILGIAIGFIINFNTTGWPTLVTTVWNYLPDFGILALVVSLIKLIQKIM
jgi:hypothetical protein